MTPEEKRRSYQMIEDNYYQEKRKINQQQQHVSAEIQRFRQQTNQLVDKVAYFTRNDTWEKRMFHHQIATSLDEVKRTENRFVLILEETEQAMRKNYRKEIEKLEEMEEWICKGLVNTELKDVFFNMFIQIMGFFTSTLLLFSNF